MDTIKEILKLRCGFILGIICGALVVYAYFKQKSDLSLDFEFILALLTAMYVIYKNNKDNAQRMSRFYLEKYIDATNSILKLLESDQPTRRIAWISAEDIAKRLVTLRNKITEEPDNEFLDIHLRNFAHHFILYLRRPWQYFYGLDQEQSLNQAFLKCGYGQFGTSTNGIAKIPEFTFIDESSIKILFDLTKFIWGQDEIANYKDDTEFLNIMKLCLPELGAYLEDLRKNLKNPPVLNTTFK